MNKLKTNLVVAAALAVLAIIGTTMNSQQANAQPPGPPDGLAVRLVSPLPLPVTGSLGVTGTVNVRNVGNIARTPFQTRLNSAGTSSFMVDPNKQLTIEFVTADCGSSTSTATGTHFTFSTTTGGKTTFHNFYPKFYRNFNSGGQTNLNFYGSTDMTRMYADPGTTVGGILVVDSFDCTVTVSGYTVPK